MQPETNDTAVTCQAAATQENTHLKSAAQRAYNGQKKALTDDQIAQYLPLVHKIAQRVAAYLKPPLSYEDLISAGAVGLVKAARDYDPSYQAEFKTYAYIRIKGAILDELRGWSFTPASVNKQIRQATHVSTEITRQTGSPPTDEKLADELGISIDQLYETYESARTQQFLSIDGLTQDGPALRNVLSDNSIPRPDEQLERTELIEKLAEAIQKLDERQRRIIVLYYQQHLTMKQIAEVFEITEPRVSQLHASALFNLFTRLRQWNDDRE